MRLSDLPVGARVRECVSGVDFLVAAHEHPGYAGTTLITDRIIAQRCLDAPEPDSPDERQRVTGCNYYPHSNLHQWLNASGPDWFVPQHPCDTPPTEEMLRLRPTIFDPVGHNAYAHKPGFLSWFGRRFREALLLCDIPCLNAGQTALELLPAKVFLPSAAELGLPCFRAEEGSMLPLFHDFRMRYASPAPDSLSDCDWQSGYYNPDSLLWYWLRTPKGADTGFMTYAHGVSPYSYKFACQSWMGVRPCVNAASSLQVIPSPNIPGLYLFGEEDGVC